MFAQFAFGLCWESLTKCSTLVKSLGNGIATAPMGVFMREATCSRLRDSLHLSIIHDRKHSCQARG